jgi:K(+)-stimulated pyrophosphate-energized sodium pump
MLLNTKGVAQSIRRTKHFLFTLSLLLITSLTILAQDQRGGGEASLVLPDLSRVNFLGGINGHTLLMIGLVVSALGMVFGLIIYQQLKNLPVHRSMLEISELIYETCKTYLITQGKFILILEAFIAVIIVLYFGVLSGLGINRVVIILLFSLVGIAGSYGVACFCLSWGQALSNLCNPTEGRDEHRHVAHQRGAADHALHSALRPG